jgi:hypothetical protein
MRLASWVPFNNDYSPHRVELGRAYAGRRSTTSHCRWVLSQACMALLRWAGSPSHNSVGLLTAQEAT